MVPTPITGTASVSGPHMAGRGRGLVRVAIMATVVVSLMGLRNSPSVVQARRRRSRCGVSASIPARVANSIPRNMVRMWGMSTAVGGSPRNRVMAGRSGKTACSPPSRSRT